MSGTQCQEPGMEQNAHEAAESRKATQCPFAFHLSKRGREFRKAMYLIPLLAEWIGRGVDGTGPVKGSIQ